MPVLAASISLKSAYPVTREHKTLHELIFYIAGSITMPQTEFDTLILSVCRQFRALWIEVL